MVGRAASVASPFYFILLGHILMKIVSLIHSVFITNIDVKKAIFVVNLF